jgi:hypothetical protein
MTHIAEHVVSGVPLLDALRATEASIAGDGTWDFGEWTQCTCGHIYFGATGSFADETTDVLRSPSASFRDVLAFVAAANGLVVFGVHVGDLAVAISGATIDAAGGIADDDGTPCAPTPAEQEALRAAALELVRTAIVAAELEAIGAMGVVAGRAGAPRELEGAAT